VPTPGRDYGYCNARVRGMRARLLPPSFFEQLLEEERFPAVVSALLNTPYRHEMEAATIAGNGAAEVDEALRHNLVVDYRKVLSFLNEEAYRLAMTILGRYDVANIKTVIRGLHVHMSVGEIEANLIAAGRLTGAELTELARQPDVRSCVDLLATWGVTYAKPLTGEIHAYLARGDTSHLELALEKEYFQEALAATTGRSENARLARRLLETQVDVFNLLTLFRMLKTDLSVEEASTMFIPGGAYIDEDLFLKLVPVSDIDPFVDLLKGTPYQRVLEESLVKYLEDASLSVLERAMEQMLITKALRLSRGDPLGLGIVMAYIWAKQNEVVNLRVIVKGKSVGMPERRIRRELIVA
jgi:V/A-type H+/Na+-transporting ATPase subunit C